MLGEVAARSGNEATVSERARRAERRRALVPAIRYPPGLPIVEQHDELLATIGSQQVVVVAGETGSGKSTQLPKLCLELGRGLERMIGHTQPRRLAARTVAERIADELATEVGALVGYTIRFNDRVGDDTLIRVMTDGILLAEIQRDRLLSRYDTIIVDEAHERSLNIDFILGYLKQLLPRRPDLKVIITSATIDTARFSAHFDDAPVVEVSGRSYPVEMRYRPFGVEKDDDRDQTQAILDAIDELRDEGPGDILVFLSGEREIRDTADSVKRAGLPGTEVLPLYARLSMAEMHRVFRPAVGRRVVLATNVAETSLTVPGIRYVVDPGMARISRYNRRTKVQRLPIEPVSQASADQRAGRCGRVAPGVCIRLYSEDDYRSRPSFTEPEILRTNLASVILQMAALGLGDVAAFPFVEPPESRNIQDGIVLLEELGALDAAQRSSRARLTSVGRRLARFPLDPRLGRTVLEADRHGCVHEVMVIAAALSIQDPRERPADKLPAANERHNRFVDADSDFLAFVNLWQHLQEQQKALSSSAFRRLCRAEFLNYLRVREWQDIYGQLLQVTRQVGIRVNTAPGDRDRIHMSLLAGLLSHIGYRDGDKKEYIGARDARFSVARDSSLFRKPPRWVMAAELVETSRLWARVVARIQPEWAERVGGHLVKRSYSEPSWDAARAAAMTTERVTLYGLPVAARRRPFSHIDTAGARRLFLQHALVEGDWHTQHQFVEENRRLVDEVRALEDRVRRRELVVDDGVIFDFFDARVPSEITSGARFDQWWKKQRQHDPHLLGFTRDMLVDPRAGPIGVDSFPDVWHQGDLALPVTYRFNPTARDDGVTVHVPLVVLERVRAEGFDWQVPGLREELVAALMHVLPRHIRRAFVPAAEYARAVVNDASPGDGRLLEALAQHLSRLGGVPVSPQDFDTYRLSPHLRITFVVRDNHDRAVAAGKDLTALQRRLRGQARHAVAEAIGGGVEVDGVREWTIGTIPAQLEAQWHGHRVMAYPALIDEGDSVALRVLTDRAEQARQMSLGTRRLLLLTLPSPTKALRRVFTNEARRALALTPYRTIDDLLSDCIACAVDRLMAAGGGPAWDEAGFLAVRDAVRDELVDTAVEIGTVVAGVLETLRRLEDRLARATAPSLQPAVTDIRGQMARLMGPGFVVATGAARLADLHRYLRAIERRLDRLGDSPARDLELMARIQRLESRYAELASGPVSVDDPIALEHVRWMLEELRVSQFAAGARHRVPGQREAGRTGDASAVRRVVTTPRVAL